MAALTRLKPETIGKIFKECVTPRSGDKMSTVNVPGITTPRPVFFDFFKLEAYRTEITELVSQLPRSFTTVEGDSFNNTDKSHRGDVWCRVETEREKLVQLAIGLRLIEIVEPRELWAYRPRQRPSLRVILR